MTRTEYIGKYTQTVIDSTKGTGLFPSVIMAQAILESSDKSGQPGASQLARMYNNHFGIKADKSWTGRKVNLKTGEVFDKKEVMIQDYFRVYDHPEQSFHDRNAFLKGNARYQKGGVFLAKTPEEQAEALQRSGYATDPVYANKIRSLINVYDLKKLDELAKKNESSTSV